MKDQRDFGLCFVCNKAPINRICLDEECIKTDSFLFCDGCRKNQNMRKFASQIYEIDSFSGPVSLFSINSYNKEEGERVSTNIKFCRQLAEDHVNKIYQKLVLIQDKSIEKLVELQGTFSVQSAQRVEELLKNAKRIDQGSFAQLLKKVKSLKWLRQNKDIAENPKVLSQKIISYTKHFQECITKLTKKIQPLINEFLTEIDAQKIFEDDKKKQLKMNNKPKDLNVRKIEKKPKIVQKPQTSSGTKIISQSQNAPSKKQQSNQDLQRINPVDEGMEAQNQEKLPYFSDGGKASSQPDRVSIFERIFPSTLPIINQSIHEEVESQKNHHQEEKKSGVIQQEQKSEPPQQERQVIRVVKKKPAKPNASERQPSEEQIKVPALVLQKLPTKADYRQDQTLIINLRNIAEIFYFFSKNQQNPQPQDNDSEDHIKEQNSQEDMPLNEARINFKRGKMPEINLERIRYLQVQQLPRLQVQHFLINIDGEEKTVKYTLTQLYEKIEAMINLEQLHVFTSYLFPTEEQFPTVMCFCPNLKVISFNCYNLFSKALQSYKGLIGDQRNQEMKVLEIAGNIPFCENLETFDIKMYFPESEKNRKIFDEYFAKNFNSQVDSQKSNNVIINEKDKFEHRNSCWWVPKNSSRLQKQRQPLILMPSENLMIASCFSQLRNCWVPYVEMYQAQEKTLNLQKIQHLSLGFHNFVLQAIPPDFFTKEKSFSKSLTNLKSLNLINLNLYEFVMKGFFNKQCKSLVSLKIQFCRGLSNSFYVSLPNYCPKLKKLSVNNLSNDINTEFIMNFQELETIILPWAEFTQQKPIQNGFEKQNQQKLPSELNGNKQIHIQDNQPEPQRLYVLKKFKYINFYGCKNFTTFFFTLVDLKYLEHLNLGKCKIADHQELIYFLKMCENLKSLCLDEAQLSNSQLFRILSRLPHLERLSLANCPNLDFTVDKLSETQVRMLDEMSHLDLRMKNKISCQYTLQMQKPKFLIISRGFDVQKNQLPILAKRQIYAYSWFDDSQDPYEY